MFSYGNSSKVLTRDQFYLTVSKILVTTGNSNGGPQAKTEVLDLSIAQKFQCQDWPDYPIAVGGATIGFLGSKVLVCGGGLYTYSPTSDQETTDECHSINLGGTEFVKKMLYKRWYAASVNVNKDTIWISGGHDNVGDILSSSELMKVEGSMAGPELPMPLQDHKMIAINSDLIMVIGGYSPERGVLSQTFYYDHSNEHWIDGPKLNQVRFNHAAGIIIDGDTHERLVIVTGGIDSLAYDDNYTAFKSTEILQDGDWSLGILLSL